MGCQKDDAARRDPVDESYKLIDRGDYTQAIRDLQTLMIQDQRPSVRVALASAYAARAGIRVENYWGFVIGFEASALSPGSLPVLAPLQQPAGTRLDPRDRNALGSLTGTMSVWERYKKRVTAIPTVSGKDLIDLKAAVGILAGVSTPGGRLYRAILNLILFKSYLLDPQGPWEEFSQVVLDLIGGDIQVLCGFDFAKLLVWLEPVTFQLTETLNDLIIAYPDKREDLEEARALVQEVYNLTQGAVAELRQKRACP